MTRQRVVVSIIAAAVLVGGLPIAFLLPMYTCMDHYEFEEFPGPGGGPNVCVH